MDSFILEQQAYERIDQVCSEAEKAFFPKYYGTLGNPMESERAIILEPLRSSLRSRCICSSPAPSYLMADLQLLRDDLDAFESEGREGRSARYLPPFERKWCESLFIDRLKRLTALHSIGVTHGDIKEDHFRLSDDDFHDTVLFDFSHSCTFTPQRPYMVQTTVIYSRYAYRLLTFRSLQKLVQMERDHVRGLARTRYAFSIQEPQSLSFLSFYRLSILNVSRVQKNSIHDYFSNRSSIEDVDFLLLPIRPSPHHLELIAMRVFQIPEGMHVYTTCC